MSEYIRREDAVEALDGKIIVTGHENADAVLQYMKDISNKIKSLEPADVAPVRHGKWTKLFYDGFNCNKCGSTFVIMQGRNNMYYCPNCGAKMDEGKKKNE